MRILARDRPLGLSEVSCNRIGTRSNESNYECRMVRVVVCRCQWDKTGDKGIVVVKDTFSGIWG